MSTFGNDLAKSLREALAHAKGDGPAIVHLVCAYAPDDDAISTGAVPATGYRGDFRPDDARTSAPTRPSAVKWPLGLDPAKIH